ncbi:MAG: hypothetical protein NTV94_14075 [Planctomycetota bacterium]|nr:hypothetical protein [Planctomycetota bacterium]
MRARWWLLIVWTVVASSFIERSTAQSMSIGVSSPQNAFKPAINAGDISVIARVLSLGEAERDALRALHEGHLSSVKARRDAVQEELQERIERAQITGDWEAAQASTQEQEMWTGEAKKLCEGFLADLKSLLTREQVDRWPLVERELRRFDRIGAGRFGGESIDVIRLVEDLAPKVWLDQAAADVLTEYATKVDGLIKARDEAINGEQSGSFHALAKTDKAAAERVWAAARAGRIALRDLNQATAERIAGFLPDTQAFALRRKVMELAYPTLMKPTRTEAFVRAVGDLDSLDAPQREAVQTIVTDYDRRLWDLLKEMASVRREQDAAAKPVELRENAMQTATTADGQEINFISSANIKANPDDPLVKVKLRRLELDRDTKQKLMPILKEAQAEACRQPPAEQLLFGEDEFWGL